MRQLHLENYGVRQVRIGPGEAVMYAADGRAELFLTVDDALAHTGFAMIVELGGQVFVEPWDSGPVSCAIPAAQAEPTKLPPQPVMVHR